MLRHYMAGFPESRVYLFLQGLYSPACLSRRQFSVIANAADWTKAKPPVGAETK
jgi:hypothetical protein